MASEDDHKVKNLKKQWGLDTDPQPPPPLLLCLPLSSYSDLLRLVGRLEGLALGAALNLSSTGSEVGKSLLVEVDRTQRLVDRVLVAN